MKTSFHRARSERSFASPRARRALLQRNLDGKKISGSGPNNRILEADVLQYQAPISVPISAPEATRSTPLTSHLRAEINVSRLWRMSEKFKSLSVTDILLKAFACALKNETQIGLTTASGKTISIPDAKQLTIFELAKLRRELAESDAGSTPPHVLSNAGRGRIDEYDTSLSERQKTALSAGSIAPRPFVTDGKIEVRPTLKLCLSFDALALNRNDATELFERIIELVEEPDLLAFY